MDTAIQAKNKPKNWGQLSMQNVNFGNNGNFGNCYHNHEEYQFYRDCLFPMQVNEVKKINFEEVLMNFIVESNRTMRILEAIDVSLATEKKCF